MSAVSWQRPHVFLSSLALRPRSCVALWCLPWALADARSTRGGWVPGFLPRGKLPHLADAGILSSNATSLLELEELVSRARD